MSKPSPADSPIEIVRPPLPRGRIRAVLLDFDGTLSLLRRGWTQVMIPLMVEVLQSTATDESPETLAARVEEFVMRLNGRQTIHQMAHLAEEVKKRGGTPLDPLEYKHQYHDRLWKRVAPRLESLEQGRVSPEELTVPGARRLLETLAARGLPLYLASGTDLNYVRDELQALRLDHFFDPHIYGALDDHRNFSKAMIIEKIIQETGASGPELLAFGDGFVEIEETRRVGGVAIGVASEEETRRGVNAWKRSRLIEAGADVIIGDYRRHAELLDLLGL